MSDPTLLLRDIHRPPPPSWWPPAPGWWLLAVVLALLFGAWAWWRRRRRRHRASIARIFDDALAIAATPSARIAAMSEQLRRASRRVDPHADRLEGDEWLRFLDRGMPQPVFAREAGRLLLEGGFRRDVDASEVEGLQAAARERFLRWMEARG